MSAPIYNGGAIAAFDDQLRPYLKDDGNWSLQGTDEKPQWRAVLLRVNDSRSEGYEPTPGRELFAAAMAHPGASDRASALAYRWPAVNPGNSFYFIVTGGYGPSRDPYWDPNAPEYMEWNSKDPRTLEYVVAKTPTVYVPVDQPPQKNDAQLAQEHFLASSIGKTAMKTWSDANPGEFNRWHLQGDHDPAHYATKFGKFLAYLRRAGWGS